MRFFVLFLLQLPIWASTTLTLQNLATLLPQTGDRPTFAPGTLVRASLDASYPDLPPSIDLTAAKLRFRSSTLSVEVSAISASFFEITVRIPEELPLGDAEVELIGASITVPARPIRVVRSLPAIFSVDSSSGGLATAYNVDREQGTMKNGLTHPLQPGQYLSIWTTGLGRVPTSEVQVRIGQRAYVASYAGALAGSPGVEQINVLIPADGGDWPEGCYTPVTVEVGTAVSNVLSVTTGRSGAACVHPLGLTLAEMTRLDDGQTVKVGQVSLDSVVIAPQAETSVDGLYRRAEWIRVSFFNETATTWKAMAATAIQPLSTECGTPDFGVGLFGFFSAIEPRGDTGDRIDLTTPRFQGALMPIDPVPLSYGLDWGTKQAADPAALTATDVVSGVWQLRSGGGKAIGPLSLELQVPPPIRWLNANALQTIDRKQGTAVLWDPTGYGDRDLAQVWLRGTNISVKGFVCQAPAARGVIEIPAELLRSLDVGSSSGGSPGAIIELSISRQPAPTQWFSLPPPSGGSVRPGIGFFSFVYSDVRRVEVK